MTPTPGPDAGLLLAGTRIVEVSSFVAVPLAGMTLGQLGADVTRVDPIGGAADYHRWPLTDDGESLYWASLNKGKRSLAANFRDPEAQALIADLIVDAGILVTNAAGRDWLDHDTLAARRPDLVHVQLLGRADGGAAVDYTVNAAMGFPLATGPVGVSAPVNHLLPAWDVAAGLYMALAVAAAVRRRDATGLGARIVLPLEDVALATVGNLGYLAEAQFGGPDRERLGTAVYGTFGTDVVTSDGARFMLVALTPRHFADLTALTGTTDAVKSLETALGVDFRDEGTRFRHRDTLSGLIRSWFLEHTAVEAAEALAASSVLHERYRTFRELAADPMVTDNPMFSVLDQPRIGPHLAPGLPMAIDGRREAPRPAPANGDDTAAVLAERLGLSADRLTDLTARGIVKVSAPTAQKDAR
ncbi:CoA transferase [Rhodococcus gannanensis]|uniref:CoA transferase n=1 Tax=Rhodococcus gannanensis TaxID=1960308 RepID=A0ABW4NXS7_9NOCA